MRLLALISLLLALSAPQARSSGTEPPWTARLVAPGQEATVEPGAAIGPLALGARIEEAYRTLGPRGRKYSPDPGNVIPYLTFRATVRDTYGARGVATHTWYLTAGTSLVDPRVVVVESERGRMSAIEVQGDQKYRTRDGIGVGSAESEIRQRLGAPDRVSEGLGGRTLMYLRAGVRFTIVLDEDRYVGGVTFLRELVRGYQGKAYLVGVFCRWSPAPGGLEPTDC